MAVREVSGVLSAEKQKFAIVASRFNDFFVKQLISGALDCLVRHGAKESDITIVWVPGSFEMPLVIQRLARSRKYDALVALGTVIQGATPHAGLIGAQVTRALTQIAMAEGVPVIDGIITAETIEQAIERAGTKSGNRGWKAALAAIEMASVMQGLGSEEKGAGRQG